MKTFFGSFYKDIPPSYPVSEETRRLYARRMAEIRKEQREKYPHLARPQRPADGDR